MSPSVILGALLAVSIAANAWLFTQRDKWLAAEATARQLNREALGDAQRQLPRQQHRQGDGEAHDPEVRGE